MSGYYIIKKEDVEKGTKLCLQNIYSILNDVGIICSNKGSERTAVVLYTIAVEEFGKILLLRSYLNTEPRENNYYKVNKSIFGKGKGSHEEKFVIAIKSLPEVCIAYQRMDVYENEYILPLTYREELLHLRKKIDELKSGFGSVKGSIQLAFDFEMRKNLLYLDWNEKLMKWNPQLTKNHDLEYFDLMDRLEGDLQMEISRGETILEWEVDNELVRIEEEVHDELEDEKLKVEDVNHSNVLRLPFPTSLLYTVKFFRKYLKSLKYGEMIKELVYHVYPHYTNTIIEKIDMKINSTNGGVQSDFDIGIVTMKPYIEFVKIVDEQPMPAARFTFQLEISSFISIFTPVNNSASEYIELKKLGIDLEISLLHMPFLFLREPIKLTTKTFEIQNIKLPRKKQ